MSLFLHPIDLASLHLEENLFLAPMAGYSGAAFRELCLRFGASLCFSEMISAEALSRGSPQTLGLARRGENERHLALQLFGADPRALARAVRALEPLGPALYDLNCGCSVPKVLKTGSGAALLRDPPRIGQLVRAMAAETRAPISVKLRSGWDSRSLTYLEAARHAVEAGAAMLSLHPRTRAQGFSGRADWSLIGALKAASPVPVIGSGDLLSAPDALAMMRETGCDGVMFARGALGNPFVFAAARRLLAAPSAAAAVAAAASAPPEPSPAQRLQTALEHLRREVALKGEALACREMRKHMCHYTKGLPGGAELRRRTVRAATLAEYAALLGAYAS